MARLVSGVRGGALEAELGKLLGLQTEMYDRADEITEAIEFLDGLDSEARRKEFMARRYLVDRQVRWFGFGGFEPHFARRVATAFVAETEPEVGQIEQPSYMAEDTDDLTGVQKLGKAESATSGLAAFMKKAMAALGDSLSKRKADIAKHCKKKDWASGLARFENIAKNASDLGIKDKVEYATDAGAGLWLYGLRVNHWRFDPDAMPGAGLPTVFMAVDCTITVSLFEVCSLLAVGITVNDLQTLETPSGRNYAKDHNMIVVVPKGEVLYVPAGLMPIVTYAAPKELADSEPFGFALFLNIFSVALTARLDANTVEAISKFNMSYLETVTNKVFGARAGLFTRYFAAVREGLTS